MLSVLREHQSEFAMALAQADDNEFIKKIKKDSKITPQLALDIYRNNTRGARLNALKLIFPICKKILGDETFHSIARQYVTEDDKGISDLNAYGETFSWQLSLLLSAGRLPEDYAYLSDLAKLEYKLHAAYYASNDPLFPFQLFEQKINNEEPVYLTTSSSCALLTSEYPIYEIWLSNKNQQYEEKINPLTELQYLLVYRSKYQPVVAVINHDQYRIMEAIVDNHSVQKIIGNTECDVDVDVILANLIMNKWVVGIG